MFFIKASNGLTLIAADLPVTFFGFTATFSNPVSKFSTLSESESSLFLRTLQTYSFDPLKLKDASSDLDVTPVGTTLKCDATDEYGNPLYTAELGIPEFLTFLADLPSYPPIEYIVERQKLTKLAQKLSKLAMKWSAAGATHAGIIIFSESLI